MSKGRHSAGPVAGRRRATTGVRRSAPGARKAPPEARRASPARAGGARVAGRRVADGGGRPVVLTALGSGEKLLALVPLAILSVASVAGLMAMGNDDPATSSSPTDSGTAARSPRHETTDRHVVARGTSASARTGVSETVSPVVDEVTSPEAAIVEPESVDESATAAPPAEPSEEPGDRPADVEPTSSVPTSSPTADPDPTDTDSLTRVEATAQCLESGISTLDVLALGACVDELLG